MSILYGFSKGRKLKLVHETIESLGLRKDIILFIRENSIQELNEIYDKIKLVEEKQIPTEEQIRDLMNKGMMFKDIGRYLTWEEIFDANGTILTYYKENCYYLPDSSKMIDNRFVEKLYIINLNENKFEIYQKNENETKCRYKGYELRRCFDLENIPRDWDRNL